MKKCDCTHPSCSVARASQLIGDMWVLLIVRDLLSGPKRFNQLQQSLTNVEDIRTISSKTLCERLRMLESMKIVNRKLFPEIPPHVEYSLTEKGQALSKVMDQIRSYGEQYMQ